MDSSLWQGADAPSVIRSPLTFPPCECGAPLCPDRPSVGPEGGESPALSELRARVREENRARERFGRSAWTV